MASALVGMATGVAPGDADAELVRLLADIA